MCCTRSNWEPPPPGAYTGHFKIAALMGAPASNKPNRNKMRWTRRKPLDVAANRAASKQASKQQQIDYFVVVQSANLLSCCVMHCCLCYSGCCCCYATVWMRGSLENGKCFRIKSGTFQGDTRHLIFRSVWFVVVVVVARTRVNLKVPNAISCRSNEFACTGVCLSLSGGRRFSTSV